MATPRSWEDLIAEGEQLKIMEERVEAEAGNVRWHWGDLALEVAPVGHDKSNTGSYQRLREFAEALDISFESLRQYRTVAYKWPHGMRVPSQPWAVHQQIMGRSDREELIANPVDVRTGEKVDTWTFRSMQRYLGHKESPSYIAPPSSSEDKAEVVAGYLADEDVVALVVENDTAVTNILEAITKPGSSAPTEPTLKPFDERCMSWVNRLNGLMMEGAQLANEADELGHASDTASSHLAILLYQRLSEKKFDAEVRQLLEAEGA